MMGEMFAAYATLNSDELPEAPGTQRLYTITSERGLR